MKGSFGDTLRFSSLTVEMRCLINLVGDLTILLRFFFSPEESLLHLNTHLDYFTGGAGCFFPFGHMSKTGSSTKV